MPFQESLVLDDAHGIRDGHFNARYRFPNGFGASVIGSTHNGEVEVGVIRYFGPGENDWTLTYDTPITDDVIGHVTLRISSLAAAPIPASEQP